MTLERSELDEIIAVLEEQRIQLRGVSSRDEVLHNRTVNVCVQAIERWYADKKANHKEEKEEDLH